MAGDKLKDSTPNEHEAVGIGNYNTKDYATNNKYGQDLSGISYKEGIEKHFGGDGSIGGNDVKDMMKAGYSADDIYNFSKKRGLNYNKHGREYLKREGDFNIGKGSDQWGDVFGTSDGGDKVSTTPDTSPKDPEVTAPKPVRVSSPVQTINPTPIYGGSGSGPTQNINQDNDQTSTVVGDGNTVNQNQDNSISQGGYSSRRMFMAQGMKDDYVLNLMNRTGV